MKKLTGLLLILSLFTITTFAQTPDQKAIAKQIETLRKAMIAGDRATLNSLTLPDLHYAHSMDVIQTRSGFVDSLATKTWTFTKIMITKQEIHVSGNTATVTHRLYGDIKNVGKDAAKTALGVMQVWKKVNGKWLLLARSAYKLTPPNDVPPVQ
jgi:ketosteroid isomerase-like protein